MVKHLNQKRITFLSVDLL